MRDQREAGIAAFHAHRLFHSISCAPTRERPHPRAPREGLYLGANLSRAGKADDHTRRQCLLCQQTKPTAQAMNRLAFAGQPWSARCGSAGSRTQELTKASSFHSFILDRRVAAMCARVVLSLSTCLKCGVFFVFCLLRCIECRKAAAGFTAGRPCLGLRFASSTGLHDCTCWPCDCGTLLRLSDFH